MPTKKRGKGARSADRRSTPRAARGARRPKRSAPAARKKAVARGTARRAEGRASSAPPAARAAAASRELSALKREKSAFEKRLTETVREIGQLRHHEARAAQLERQLKERDDTIVQLRKQLSDLRNRDEEVQPSLALGSRRADDLDDFDEDVGAEDDDELI